MLRFILLAVFAFYVNPALSASLKIKEQADSYLNVTDMYLEEDTSRLAVLAGNKISIFDAETSQSKLSSITAQELNEQIYEGRDILLFNNNIYITSSKGKFIWARWDRANSSIDIAQVSNIMRDNTECLCSMLLSESKKYIFIVNANRLEVYKLTPSGRPVFLYDYGGPDSRYVLDAQFSKNEGLLLLLTNNNQIVSIAFNEKDGAVHEISAVRYKENIISISTDRYSGAVFAITNADVDPDTHYNSYIRTLDWHKEQSKYLFGLKHPIRHQYQNKMAVYKGNIYVRDGSKLKHFYHDAGLDKIIKSESEFDFGLTLTDLSIAIIEGSLFASSGTINGIQSFSIKNNGILENKGLSHNEDIGLTPIFADTAINSDGTRLYSLTNKFYLQTYARDPKNGKIRFLHEVNTSLAHNKKADGERLVLDDTNNFLYLSLNDIIKVYSLDAEQGIPTLNHTYDLQLPIYLNSHDLYLSIPGERLYAVGTDVWKFKLDLTQGTILALEAREGFNNADQMVFTSNDEFVYMMDRGDQFFNLVGGIFGYKQDLNSGSWQEVFALRNDFDNEAIEISSDDKYIFAETDEGINIYLRDTLTGSLTLEKTMTGYTDNSGVDRIFYDIFRLKLLNNDKDLLVFSYNNILHFKRVGEDGTFEFVDRLYLPTNVDESSGSGGSYLTTAPDERFFHYSSINPEAAYILSLIDESESDLTVVNNPTPQFITDSYYEKDIKVYIDGDGSYIFRASNLPPGMHISDEGIISGQIDRTKIEEPVYDSLITVSDGVSSVTIDLEFIVNLDNTAPEGESQSLKIESGDYLYIDLSMQDSESDTVRFDITKHPTSGFVTIADNAKGKVRYQATKDVIDMDVFEYTLSDYGLNSGVYKVLLSKEQSNIAPIANHDTITTEFETPVTIDILENDTDGNGQLLHDSITIVTQAQNGALDVMGIGKVKYSPASDFFGDDSFQYKIKDDQGAFSNVATVSIRVKEKVAETEPNNPPLNDGGGSGGGGGSTPVWLLSMLLLAFTARRYYK